MFGLVIGILKTAQAIRMDFERQKKTLDLNFTLLPQEILEVFPTALQAVLCGLDVGCRSRYIFLGLLYSRVSSGQYNFAEIFWA